MAGDEIIRSEAAIIQEFLAPLTAGDAGAASLQDDCAVITPVAGMDLVVTTDSMIEGVHFFAGDRPAFKALAVNVSDLIAKGARPWSYLLTLALPGPPTRTAMRQLADDLQEAQCAFGCRLIGGDTDRTPGNFTITISAFGLVDAGRTVRRSGARIGDAVVVTGTIGDAALGLKCRRDPLCFAKAELDQDGAAHLLERFNRPRPNTAIAGLISSFANASMDVSDGLAKDLGRLCGVSGVGAEIETERVPLSSPVRSLVASGRVRLADVLAGGEDYEALFTVPKHRIGELNAAAAEAGVALSVIGSIVEGSGVSWRDGSGKLLQLANDGWDHF